MPRETLGLGTGRTSGIPRWERRPSLTCMRELSVQAQPYITKGRRSAHRARTQTCSVLTSDALRFPPSNKPPI